MVVWLHETSQPHHMQAITDGVAKILQLTCGIKCSLLLYHGSIHSSRPSRPAFVLVANSVSLMIINAAPIRGWLPLLLHS